MYPTLINNLLRVYNRYKKIEIVIVVAIYERYTWNYCQWLCLNSVLNKIYLKFIAQNKEFHTQKKKRKKNKNNKNKKTSQGWSNIHVLHYKFFVSLLYSPSFFFFWVEDY